MSETLEEMADRLRKKLEEYSKGSSGQSGNTNPGQGGNTNPGQTGNSNPGQGGNPNPGQTGNPNPGQGNTQNSGQGQNPTPNTSQFAEAGVSNAYAGDILKFKETPPKKKDKASSGIDLPKREKGGKVGDAKDIMEFFWKECILASYAWLLDKITNIPINMIEFCIAGGTAPSETEKEKPNPYKAASEIFQERMTQPLKNKLVYEKAANEIINNIEKERNGETAEWAIWGKEPACYKGFKDLAEKAKNDANSPEAKVWEKFKQSPAVLQDYFEKEQTLQNAALLSAAFHEVIDKDAKQLPKEFIKKLDDLKKAIDDKKASADDLKTNVGNKVDALLDGLDPNSVAYKDVIENLKKIKTIATGNENNSSVIRKEMKEKYKSVKEATKKVPEDKNFMKERISETSNAYYQRISENIDKIYEQYQGNPDLAKEQIKSYVDGIKGSIKTVQKSCDKVENWQLYPKIMARKNMEKITSAIEEYKLDGRAIGSINKAQTHDESPLKGDKAAMLNLIKNFNHQNG